MIHGGLLWLALQLLAFLPRRPGQAYGTCFRRTLCLPKIFLMRVLEAYSVLLYLGIRPWSWMGSQAGVDG